MSDEKKRKLEQETNGEELPDREIRSTTPFDLTGFPPIVPTGEELDSER
jgi:hypothetical protein